MSAGQRLMSGDVDVTEAVTLMLCLAFIAGFALGCGITLFIWAVCT